MSTYQLGDFCADAARPIKVVVIGAGYSGTYCFWNSGRSLRQKVKNVDLTIYEAHSGVGGTWFVNKYPGLACDVPSHAKNWSQFYVSGPEILKYIEGVVDKYKLHPYIKLQHRVVGLRYDEATGKWHISLRRPSADKEGETEVFEDVADVVLSAVGSLSIPTWPDIQGIESFEGELIHSAAWKTKEGEGAWEDTVKTWGEKRVGVIGVGSSGIQIVANLQPRVKQLINYVRGKTWISSTFLRDKLLDLSGGEDVPNCDYKEKDLKNFEDDHRYQEYRRSIEHGLMAVHIATLHGNPLQQLAREAFTKDMRQRLEKKPWIADHLIPDFAVACRRLTPGPGYLEALCEDNCDFVPTPIKQILPNGIETADGKIQELDVIVCATGFDTSSRYGFPIVGRNGLDLADKYTPVPRTYLGIATDGFPNFFHVFGPNTGVGAGSLLLIIERQAEYAVQATLKLQRERLKSMEVKAEAVDDFDQYLETVFGQKCRSWYKAGKSADGRVTGLWPGSPLHAAKALEYPRWEDYSYERLDGDPKNRFYYFGDGNTAADVDPEADKAWYLLPENIDHPPSE
ncbi:FAD/NAD(P)-binding domain-containing protein [Macrolepiota fuliginosa MF-IS2]|uniref:FAD/NAD(P)-binding domain-containing protein n=1 Tax=Macrolepiota fuliginosa MF-IS2 TaxID=1400762 RepID=A0A9P6C6P4_9AGAR|nr:FAD/NAD(P)-binding domain-containing protein [Macrolepiota fuliginosa MF-IS2]